MPDIYFDNSATTEINSSVCDKIYEVLKSTYGNPSSLHTKGFEASKVVEDARKTIAAELCAEPNEIIFTSSGTEGNNLAVLGAALAKKRTGKRIVSSAIEHPSVARSLDHLEYLGFEVIRILPDIHGNIQKSQIIDAINADTILVSMMLVNNEIGSCLPVECIKKAILRCGSKAYFHCDAVQAFGKIPVNVKALEVDLLTVSAHKIEGPKGVGALYVKKGTNLFQLLFGGGQEKSIRPGTQNVPCIAGFEQAVLSLPPKDLTLLHLKALSSALKNWLLDIENVVIHSDKDAFASIVSFSLLGIKSEVMLHALADKGIYVSSGSACAKGKESEIMRACSIPDEQISSAIRVSFSHKNTLKQVLHFVNVLKELNKTLVKAN